MPRPRPLRCALLVVTLAMVIGNAPAPAATPLPMGWPAHMLVGMADEEHGAADLRASTPLEARYHYLAGGVNTGQGWLTWAGGNGSFATGYITDSQASGFLPVFSLYEIRPSLPGAQQSDEAAGDLQNLRTRATMRAFYSELQDFFVLAAAAGGPVVLHVEPDLWGYVERANGANDASKVPAQVASTGLEDLAGLPNTAAGMAQAIVRLRNRYAPNVVLGYHLSVWGTGVDIARSDPSDAKVDELAARSVSFYRSLHANFDVVFAEYADRTAGYAKAVNGDSDGWWTAADFARHARYLGDVSSALDRRVVLWQIPLGNRVMRAMDNTPHHYQDNRVEWLLGPGSREHLQTYAAAGVIGLLFGKAQADDTCACDDAGDGVTDPAPIGSNTRASLRADDDGGYFRHQASAYYAAGPLALPAAATRPVKGRPARRVRVMALHSRALSGSVRRGHTVSVRLSITSGAAATALVAVQFFPPGATRPAYQVPLRDVRFRANRARRLVARLHLPVRARTGRWQVKVGVFDPDWQHLYVWLEDAGRFSVS